MNTEIIDRFEVLNADRLASVVGGNGVCRFVMATANGYSCRYDNGKWGYVVTKSPFEATRDVVVNGWISSMGGGYFNRK